MSAKIKKIYEKNHGIFINKQDKMIRQQFHELAIITILLSITVFVLFVSMINLKIDNEINKTTFLLLTSSILLLNIEKFTMSSKMQSFIKIGEYHDFYYASEIFFSDKRLNKINTMFKREIIDDELKNSIIEDIELQEAQKIKNIKDNPKIKNKRVEKRKCRSEFFKKKESVKNMTYECVYINYFLKEKA